MSSLLLTAVQALQNRGVWKFYSFTAGRRSAV